MSIIRQDYGSIYDPHAESLIAPIQETLVANRAYVVGECFILDGVMYKVIQAITQGSTIVIGTDCEVAPPVTDMMMGDIVIGTPEPIGLVTINNTTYTKYKCIVDFGALPSDATYGEKTVATGIVGNIRLLSMKGICYSSTISVSLTIPFVNEQQKVLSMSFVHSTNSIKIVANYVNSYNSCYVELEYYHV